jgi:K+ transporter
VHGSAKERIHEKRLGARALWFFLVLPVLLLNYCGQGALLLTRPEPAVSPFCGLAPGWASSSTSRRASCEAARLQAAHGGWVPLATAAVVYRWAYRSNRDGAASPGMLAIPE